jgi:hypothetical protein
MNPATLQLPAHLTVVQVGDLIHRGPASDAVVAFVDSIMKENPGRWVQLAGNHESLYLAEPSFHCDETVSDATIDTLWRWWETGTMMLAAAFEVASDATEPAQVLITHAGLTHGCWNLIGAPSDAHDAAAAINSYTADQTSPVWNQGRMLTGYVDYCAGVIWAEAGTELVSSWMDSGCNPGFDQIHGHSTAYWWSNRRWQPDNLGQALMGHTTLYRKRRHIQIDVYGQTIWGIDPAHGRYSAPQWRALTLSSADR